MTKRPVNAGIYSTATGEFIVYSENQLTEEWERLRTLRLDDFESEIADFR